MLYVICFFFFFLLIYTVLWYVLAPIIDTLSDTFSQLSFSWWSSEANSAYSNILSVFRYSWTWIGILSLISAVIWMYIYPFKEEPESVEYTY